MSNIGQFGKIVFMKNVIEKISSNSGKLYSGKSRQGKVIHGKRAKEPLVDW
jgi:hypothetical protein